ncbi:MAG TPA: hypothetical protein VEV85_02375, partial [Bryobacteraceae bacterium]|nr:hypothetical protein [Bryobacteraceae bacterium]
MSLAASSTIDRRAFLTAAAGAALLPAARAQSTSDLKPVFSEVEKRHDESVRRIQEWIRQPTIAAEDKGIAEGADLMMQLLRDVGCGQVVK